MTTARSPVTRSTPRWQVGLRLLLVLTRRELGRRYAASLVGTLWAVLQPLGLVAIYLLVFGFMLNQGRGSGAAMDFALYMLAGMLPHQAMAEGLQRACGALREDKLLLEREDFLVESVPLARVACTVAAECAGLLLLAAASAAQGHGPGAAWLLLPLLVLLRLVWTAGLALVLSVLTVFVADVAEVLGFLLTGLLFLTPVFYTVEQMPQVLRWTLPFNPLYLLASAYRTVLTGGAVPWLQIGTLAVLAAASLAVGIWFFRRCIDQARDLL